MKGLIILLVSHCKREDLKTNLIVGRGHVGAEDLSVEVGVRILLDDFRVELGQDLLGALAQRPPVPPQADPHEGVARCAVVTQG